MKIYRFSVRARLLLCVIPLLCLLFLIGACSCGGTEIVAQGTTDGIVWTLDSTGRLSFSGTGAIPGVEYILDPDTGLTSTVQPEWYVYRDRTVSVGIGREIDYISMNAFLSFDRLRTVDISASVARIDGNAFSNCTALESVMVRGKGTTLERYCIGYTGSTPDDNLTGIVFRGVSGSTIERYAGGCGAFFKAL